MPLISWHESPALIVVLPVMPFLWACFFYFNYGCFNVAVIQCILITGIIDFILCYFAVGVCSAFLLEMKGSIYIISIIICVGLALQCGGRLRHFSVSDPRYLLWQHRLHVFLNNLKYKIFKSSLSLSAACLPAITFETMSSLFAMNLEKVTDG